MFENDNYQTPLIEKGTSLSQARVLFINECESFLNKFEIDNSKPKKEMLNKLSECEQICSILLNKINDIGLQISTNKQNNNTEIIREIVFSINSSFEKVKEHFEKENNKYFMSLQKEKDLDKKLYNKERGEQTNPEIQNIIGVIGACLSEVQKNLDKINSICPDPERNKIYQNPQDSFINVNFEKENKDINLKKFEIIPLIIGFTLFILILLFSIYLYICYLK